MSDRHRAILDFACAQHLELHFLADPILLERSLQITEVLDRFAADPDDRVAEHEARALRGTFRLNVEDQEARRLLSRLGDRRRQSHRLCGDAEEAAARSAVIEDRGDDARDGLGGDGEAGAAQDAAGVDADSAAVRGEEGSAREAGVRAEICMTAVPSLMRVVRAPIQQSGEKTSEPYASAVQAESKPRRSASRTSAVGSQGSGIQ